MIQGIRLRACSLRFHSSVRIFWGSRTDINWPSFRVDLLWVWAPDWSAILSDTWTCTFLGGCSAFIANQCIAFLCLKEKRICWWFVAAFRFSVFQYWDSFEQFIGSVWRFSRTQLQSCFSLLSTHSWSTKFDHFSDELFGLKVRFQFRFIKFMYWAF